MRKYKLNLKDQFNSILIQEIENIKDSKTKEICKLALEFSKQGFERGQKPVNEFISNQIEKHLTRIVGN